MKYIVRWQVRGDEEQNLEFDALHVAREAVEVLKARGTDWSWAVEPCVEVAFAYVDLVRERRALGNMLVSLGHKLVRGTTGTPDDVSAEVRSIGLRLDDVLAQIDAIERDIQPDGYAQTM